MKHRFSLEDLSQRIAWEDIDPDYIKKLITIAKEEDLEGLGLRVRPPVFFDVTTDNLSVSGKTLKVSMCARESLTVCGISLVGMILDIYEGEVSVTYHARDGDQVEKGDILVSLEGSFSVILSAERVMLNFIQHLSGISTYARCFVDQLQGSSVRLLDTRKTRPGYRVLEKYAVACAGAWNHRLGLFDRAMLKDNHWGYCLGGIGAWVESVKASAPGVPVEVEVDNLGQLRSLLGLDIDIVLLDNFSIEDIRQAVLLAGKDFYLEVSGNVNMDTLSHLKELGVDFISSGALTHQSAWVDIGLDYKC